MKITRRQLRRIIRESINEIRVNVGGDITSAEFSRMADFFGKPVETQRTGRDSYYNYIHVNARAGDFYMKHHLNMSLGTYFTRYSLVPHEGSGAKPIKDEPVSSEREMYEIVQSYLKMRSGVDGKLVPLPRGLRGETPGTGIIG